MSGCHPRAALMHAAAHNQALCMERRHVMQLRKKGAARLAFEQPPKHRHVEAQGRNDNIDCEQEENFDRQNLVFPK